MANRFTNGCPKIVINSLTHQLMHPFDSPSFCTCYVWNNCLLFEYAVKLCRDLSLASL